MGWRRFRSCPFVIDLRWADYRLTRPFTQTLHGHPDESRPLGLVYVWSGRDDHLEPVLLTTRQGTSETHTSMRPVLFTPFCRCVPVGTDNVWKYPPYSSRYDSSLYVPRSFGRTECHTNSIFTHVRRVCVGGWRALTIGWLIRLYARPFPLPSVPLTDFTQNNASGRRWESYRRWICSHPEHSPRARFRRGVGWVVGGMAGHNGQEWFAAQLLSQARPRRLTVPLPIPIHSFVVLVLAFVGP